MSHPDHEVLVGLALDDDETGEDVERTSLVLTALTQLAGRPVDLEHPPAHVWADIRESLRGDALQCPDARAGSATH